MKLLLLLLLPFTAANVPEEEEGSHLPKEVKEELEKKFGTSLKTRVERLKRIGYEYVIPEDYSRRKVDATTSEGKVDEDLSIWEINQRAGIARYFWDGDIDLTPKQFDKLETLMGEDQNSTTDRVQRQANENVFNRWREKKVYYQFDAWFRRTRGAEVVKAVIDFYEKNTCIRFEENSTVSQKITIREGDGCRSNVGFTGNPRDQEMSLSSECWNFGNVAHEFLHSLGFHHTHARPDRDDYIKLHRENIENWMWHSNFPKQNVKNVNKYTPYDYASVMHYPAEAFSANRKIAIVAKDHRYAYTMGSRRKLTFYDLKALNEHYQCTAQCPPKVSAKCSNGGYPNPNNCTTCICPEGYGGQFCNQRPDGCGSSFVATSEWQDAQLVVSYNSTSDFIENLQCHDWITAPQGQFVEVKIKSTYGAACEYSCNKGAMEIKLDTAEATSPRVCCPTFIDSSFVSKLNPTPVIAFSHNTPLEFEYQYRFVDEAPLTKEFDPKEPTCTDKRTTCPEEYVSCWNGLEGCAVTCNQCS